MAKAYTCEIVPTSNANLKMRDTSSSPFLRICRLKAKYADKKTAMTTEGINRKLSISMKNTIKQVAINPAAKAERRAYFRDRLSLLNPFMAFHFTRLFAASSMVGNANLNSASKSTLG